MKTESFFDGPPPADAGLFGFFPHESSQEIMIVGVPWEVTTSYGRGTAAGPAAILQASHQLDLFDPKLKRSFGREVCMLPLNDNWIKMNKNCSQKALPIIEQGGRVDGQLKTDLEEINECGARLNKELYQEVRGHLKAGKLVGILGGDHSCPQGSILAHWERYPGMGILHLDAHSDLRVAYEGFLFSHASIMYNILHEIPELKGLTAVGIRDYSQDEATIAKDHPKIHTFYAHEMAEKGFQGCSWQAICHEIVQTLPQKVYVSFDIDGLDQPYCPHTGTPVPGGLKYDQAVYLLEQVLISGRKIVGFDLVEVAPNPRDAHDEWDANVGARLLHRLCSMLYRSK